MRLIYMPNQKMSSLLIETVDDMDYYHIVENELTCKAPPAMIRGYMIKKYKQNKKQRYDWNGDVKFIKESLFNTGLVFMIRKILAKHSIPYDFQVFNHKKLPLHVDSKMYNHLRPVQKDIVESLEKQYKEYGFIRKLIVVPIGAGKSYIIENFSTIFPQTTNILLVESLNLFRQYLTAGVNNVVENGIQANKTNIMMVDYYCKNYSEISRGLKEVDFLILDEVHLKRLRTVAEKYAISYLRKGMIGCTATKPDELLDRMTLYGLVSSSVYTKTYGEIYPYAPKVKIVYNTSLPCNPKLPFRTVFGAVSSDPKRLHLIKKIIILNKGKKILIATDKIGKNLKPLFKYLKEAGIHCSHIHGSQPVEYREECMKMLQRGEIQVLIASSVIKAGINLKQVDVLILNAQYRSSVPVIQFIGRMIRTQDKSIAKKIVYDIYDENYQQLREQMLSRIKIYKSLGWKVTRANI